MKKTFAAIAAASMVLCLAACGGSDTTDTTTTSDIVTESVDTTDADTNETPVAQGETLVVTFGDFDTQEAVSKSIQNGEVTGQGVEIEGVSEHLGSHYSIGQNSTDGTFVGTTYNFDGEYPASGAHVKVTGVVVADGYAFVIDATSVEVIE